MLLGCDLYHVDCGSLQKQYTTPETVCWAAQQGPAAQCVAENIAV